MSENINNSKFENLSGGKSSKEKISFAKESIAKLRDKILAVATTNRNKLINFKHQDRKRDQVRTVDELKEYQKMRDRHRKEELEKLRSRLSLKVLQDKIQIVE